MSIIKPILTEKSLKEAKSGKYSFWVGKNISKYKIGGLIEKLFDVTVKKVRTINYKGEIKRTNMGKIKRIMPRKKAIITLAGKGKIDLFESKKKSKKSK